MRKATNVRRGVVLVLTISAALTACSKVPIPSPAPTAAVPSVRAPSISASTASGPQPTVFATYDLAPTRDVQAWLAANMRIGFRALTVGELASVRLTVATAEELALADLGPGYGSDHARVIWTKVGCTFLGYYTGPMMPRLGYVPPTEVAYIVQTLAPPMPGYPGLNEGIVDVNAFDGRMGTRSGSGMEPILGTTCGVEP